MKTFEQLQQDLREAKDSFLQVDGVGKDKWIVDRVFPGVSLSGGQIAGPFKKKDQALKKAKQIARATGEKVEIHPAPATGRGGPEVLRKRKS
ncbi:MAG: hypothetical protein QQN46_09155 [Nitrosopumilus sp.]